jgi:ATP-dependent DNA helicase PIF1
LKKNCLADEQLVLKVGAQVMMLKNTLQKDGIINGSLGIIKSFNEQGFPLVTFTNNKSFIITAEEWLAEEFNHEKQEIEVKARVLQIPLVLAWAITVHKSQGMTLDAINCDLGNSFADGQVYVALSRVKSIEGLFLSSFNIRHTKVNQSVIEFYQQLEQQETSVELAVD